MKRLLIVAYFYPPSAGVGGLRPSRLVRYLPEFGWEPVVLTVRLRGSERQDAQVIETPCRDVLGEWKARLHLNPNQGLHQQLRLPLSSTPNSRRMHSQVIEWAKDLLSFPDAMKGWIPFACEALNGLDGPIDAIVSTSPPVSCHVIAAYAKRKFGCYWIADYRDLWEGGYVKQQYERRLLKSADVLVTVSETLAKILQVENPDKPVFRITNSFEPDEIPTDTSRSSQRFTITYTGTLYKGRRDPTMLLETVQELIRNGILSAEKVRLRFYGPPEPFLAAAIQKLGLEGVVTMHDRVPHEEALARQAESQLLLLLDWNGPNGDGIYTSKVFEYLGVGRPILAVGPRRSGVVADLLGETGAGYLFASKPELRQFLVQSYSQWRLSGNVPYYGDPSVILRYTSRTMAENFAEVLNGLTGQRALNQMVLHAH